MLILHGEDQVSSRNQFLGLKDQAKAQNKYIIDLPGSSLSLPELTTSVESISLLGNSNSVFIEDLFTRRPSNEKKQLLDYVSQHPNSDIYIWEGKDVSAQLRSIPPAHIKRFDLPSSVFAFLDHLSINLFHQALSSSAPEQILAILAGHIQKLILVKDNAAAKLPSWQQGKLAQQAKKFTLEKLIQMNKDLLEIDYRQKTSSSAMNLTAALELWLTSLNL